ncbi:Ti-type conjugative transfer relaxase TraA [Salmonella enterica]|nr:Ti-type conjugative transfer relaxase TraA [Salmonella enterica]EGN7527259.1 Ti-type conjugative transfer relaxase TraA [Salmonella enterica]EGO6832879.1 Ti-type conjugative transfer relaxase TraA [Salmonella enterica]EGO6840266.1 Ti-type conjugative transfer relaxase TraA [Salmonella enterica]EGO6860195.1 Ti-type conjugative transfer relaxase TraA [Salmonella enterica]
MAIFNLHLSPIKRSAGRSTTAMAAYRGCTTIEDSRTGEIHNYNRKGGHEFGEVVGPNGLELDRTEFWNALESHHKRGDATLGYEAEIAIPKELTIEQSAELVSAFARAVADKYGVGVGVDIHAPHIITDRDLEKNPNQHFVVDEKTGKRHNENRHFHMQVSACSVGINGELGKKVNELDPIHCKRRGIECSADYLRPLWEQYANDALERAGFDVRIDHRSYEAQGVDLVPTTHIGSAAQSASLKRDDIERVEANTKTRAENARRIIDHPEIILAKITATQAVFGHRDIARELSQHIKDKDQFRDILTRLEQSPELVQLAPEQTDGKRTIPARFSTRAMIEIERNAVGKAQQFADDKNQALSPSTVSKVLANYGTLSDEQRAAVEHVTMGGRCAAIVGDAGTGKSFSMRIAKEAWEAEGYRVRGCALAGKAADELEAGSGIESRTIASLELAWANGKDLLSRNDVLVIDEVGMVGSRQLSRVMDAVEKAGAKVIVLGDYKQLSAIEAGAAFRAIVETIGAAELTQIRRQTEEWAKEASAEFARGDMRKALDAYNDRGHVRINETLDDAKKALAADYLADREKGGSSIILSYRNRDVIDLNNAVRDARKEAGELQQEAEFLTARGVRSFGKGDRVVMLENSRELGVKNGSLGTVEAADDGQLTVKLDNGKTISFGADQYDQIDHGYAVTIHKSQGVTVDRAYLLATSGMGRELAYVGMTRHREQATLYAGADDFAHAGRLVAHGEAPYQHEEGNSRSYFATLENDKGEQRTIWGVDLERAIADAGTRVGDKVSFEHVGAETVQLPNGQSVQRNSWKVSTSTELAYDKLVDRLAQQKPNESTLDYMEATANYADRRGFDGFAVVGRIVERGIVKFNELADSIKYAVGRAIGYSEPRVEPQQQKVEETPKEKAPRSAFWQKTYSDADLFGEPSKPEPVSEQKPTEQPATERPPVQAVDVQEKALQHYRTKLEAAQQSGNEIEAVMAAGRLEKAEQLAAAGEPITHHGQAIEAAGSAAFAKWADREKARAEVERAFGGADQVRNTTEGMSERDKARAEVERKLGVGHSQNHGQDMSERDKARAEVERATQKSRGRDQGHGY